MNLMYINWNPDPIIFTLGGFSLRWYSVFWVIAIASASIVVHKIFQKRKMSEDDYNKLFVYSFLGIFIGARLGHCLFYDFAYYSDHLLEIVLPVNSFRTAAGNSPDMQVWQATEEQWDLC